MEMKKYLLIYDCDTILYYGLSSELEKITIYAGCNIEMFDTTKEVLIRKDEIMTMLRQTAENPSQYYHRLREISKEIDEIAVKLYRNIIHIDNVCGEKEDFNDSLRRIISIIEMDLITTMLGGEIDG